MLPLDLKQRAERRARGLGVSLGTLVRRSLEQALDRPATLSTDDPLLASRAVFCGESPGNLAADHDAWLYGEGE
jgi:hypothetical protein